MVAGAPRSTSGAGSATLPSSRWPFSSSAMIVRPTAVAVPFSVCHVARAAALGAVADVQAPGLEVGRVRARSELAVALLARQPRLAVVLLGRRGAEVADRDVHHPVGQLERLQDVLLDREKAVVLGARLLGLAEHEHLDLVELVHAEDAARVLARGAQPRGGSRARSRHSGAAGRRRRGSRRRAARPAGPRWCRSGTGRRRAACRSAARCRAGSRCRTGPARARAPAGPPAETLVRQPVEREAHQRQLEEHEVAEQVGEARARDLGPALHVDQRPGELEVVAPGAARLRPPP